MKHNLRRVLRLTEARTFWVRAVRAWRELLPDWTPSLDEHRVLEQMPREHRAAVAIISEGWDANSPKWDVLMALLEWERREERRRHQATGDLSQLAQELEETGGPIDITSMVASHAVDLETVESYERLRADSETTIETRLPEPPKLVVIPMQPSRNEFTGRSLKAFQVRTLAGLRREQGDG